MKKTSSDKTETARLMGPKICILLIILIPLAIWTLGHLGMKSIGKNGPFFLLASPRFFVSSVVFLVCPLLALSGMWLCYLTIKHASRRGLAILWTSIPFLFDLEYVLLFCGWATKSVFGIALALIMECEFGRLVRDYLIF